MSFGIFRRMFKIRRFGEDEVIEGYSHTTYTDTMTRLNVQPLSADELLALPEGERRTKRLKAYGDLTFTTADVSTGKRGDWLLYDGRWYECVSSLNWDHTMLSHCKSEFVEVAEADDEDLKECDCQWK
jgi:hypothetical protein